MISAFLRLFLISVACIILTVLAVVFARFIGSKQAFAPPPHPWISNGTWYLYDLSDPCSTQVPQPWIGVIKVRYEQDEWRVECPNRNMALAEFLAATPHPDWMIHIETGDIRHLDGLVEIVSKHDSSKRFAVLSPAQRVARYLRKKAPQWLFAADSASLLRLQIFTSLWLETVTDFWPDFVITPQTNTQLSARAAAELTRRQKRIIWNRSANEDKPEFIVHGIMTTRPSEADQLGLPK